MSSSKREDLTGKRYGRLTVIELSHVHVKWRPYWRCACNCGSVCVVSGTNLKSGHTKSCRCLQKQAARSVRTSHGMSRTPTHRSWKEMVQRCTNPNSAYFKHYGGRGITVCPSWLFFENFYADMGDRPSEKHSIDRIDNDGNYCPENCRWATYIDQSNNRRCNRYVTLQGITLTIGQWASRLGIPYNTLYMRLRRGWTPSKALKVLQKRHKKEKGGE